MTKHYCDMCGDEIKEHDIVNVSMETTKLMKRVGEPNEEWELCRECAGKVRDLIIYGEESCQN